MFGKKYICTSAFVRNDALGSASYLFEQRLINGIMKFITLCLLILFFSSSLHAERLACWKLEEGSGNLASNTGTASDCSLRIINENYGNSNVVWSIFTPDVSGENYSIGATNLNNNYYWIQSDSSVEDSSDDPNALDFDADDSFTLLIRAYWLDSDWNDGLIGKYAGWDNAGYFLSFRSSGGNGYVVLYLDDSNGGSDLREVVYGPDSSLSGQWCYVSAVIDRSSGTNSCRIYVNGELKQTTVNDVVGSLGNSDRFRLGTLFDNPSLESMHGYISEAAVWNEALTSPQIAFYNNNTFDSDIQPPVITTNFSLLPERFAVYYGYPSQVNGAGGDFQTAKNVFMDYDSIVFGAGLEESTHGDHNFTANLIPELTNSGCEIFGYIDLGVSTENYSYSTLTNKMSKWRAMGANGIFFDDYGYDYEVTRVRQTNAVAYAHEIGCVVCANSWMPDDAMGNNFNATYNPNSLPTALRSNDVYLLESYQVMLGNYAPEVDWVEKSSNCFLYKQDLGVRMFCLTSASDYTNDYSDAKWFYAYDSTVLYNFDSAAWGEPHYSASGEGANYLPWRSNHYLLIGSLYITNADNKLPLNTAFTDEGKFWIDTTAHISAFLDIVAPRVSANVIIHPENNADVVSSLTYTVSWHIDAITDMFLSSSCVSLNLINDGYTNLLTGGTANTGSWEWLVNEVYNSNYVMQLTVTDYSGNKTTRNMTGSFYIRELPEPCFYLLIVLIPPFLKGVWGI